MLGLCVSILFALVLAGVCGLSNLPASATAIKVSAKMEFDSG